jgi:hypothetical protein
MGGALFKKKEGHTPLTPKTTLGAKTGLFELYIKH